VPERRGMRFSEEKTGEALYLCKRFVSLLSNLQHNNSIY